MKGRLARSDHGRRKGGRNKKVRCRHDLYLTFFLYGFFDCFYSAGIKRFMPTSDAQIIAEDKLIEVLAEAIYLLSRQEVRNKYEKSNPEPVSHE